MRFVLAFIVMLTVAKTGHSQGIDLNRYNEQAQYYVKKLKPMLLNNGRLTAEEKSVIRNVTVTIRRGWAVQGFAVLDADEKKVVIYDGALAFIEWIADAIALEDMYQEPGFALRYINYLGGVMEKNTRYDTMGRSTRVPAASPVKAIADGTVPSSRINPRARLSREAHQYRDGLVEASFVYLLFHEYGHVVKKHGEHKGKITLEKRRQQEAEADEWAVTQALNCDFNVSAALPMFVLFGTVDNETEKLMDHPAGQKRVISSLRVIKRELQAGNSMATKYKADSKYEEVIRDIDRTITLIENDSPQ